MGEGRTKAYITRAELVERLARERVRVDEAELRRFQAARLIPPLRRYGRKGAGRGVDWGWPAEEGERVVRQLRLLSTGVEGVEEFVSLLSQHPKALEYMDEVVEKARTEGYEEGREAVFHEMMEETL